MRLRSVIVGAVVATFALLGCLDFQTAKQSCLGSPECNADLNSAPDAGDGGDDGGTVTPFDGGSCLLEDGGQPQFHSVRLFFRGEADASTATVSSACGNRECGANDDCVVNAPEGTAVRFEAHPAADLHAQFSGDCESPVATGSCTLLTETGDRSVQLRFWRGNYVFVTSSVLPNGAFGGLAGGDAFCAAVARDAGVPGTFVAYLGSDGGLALDRITKGGTDHWQNVDGTPLVSSTVMLHEHPQTGGRTGMLYPPRDERGNLLRDGLVFSGVWEDGTSVESCSDWTVGTDAGLFRQGISGAGGAPWVAYPADVNGLVRCDQPRHLYCFGVDGPFAQQLPTRADIPLSALRAFNTRFNPGTAPDITCQNAANVFLGGGTFRALVGTSTESARTHVQVDAGTDAPVYRLDGVRVADHVSDLLRDGPLLLAPIQVDVDAGFSNANTVWTGGSDLTATVPDAATCGGWLNSAANAYGRSGDPRILSSRGFSNFTQPCSYVGGKVYCLEQRSSD